PRPAVVGDITCGTACRPAISALSLRDALPICDAGPVGIRPDPAAAHAGFARRQRGMVDREDRPGLGHCLLDQPSRAAFGRSLHRSEEHTSELQTRRELVCRLLLEKKKVTPCRE